MKTGSWMAPIPSASSSEELSISSNFGFQKSSPQKLQTPNLTPSHQATSVLSSFLNRAISFANPAPGSHPGSPRRPPLTRGSSLDRPFPLMPRHPLSRPMRPRFAATRKQASFDASFEIPSQLSQSPVSRNLLTKSVSASVPDEERYSPLPRLNLPFSDSETREFQPLQPIYSIDEDSASNLAPRADSEPVNPVKRTTTTTRRKLDASFRNDSLSSDQSECLQQPRPPPPKPYKRRVSADPVETGKNRLALFEQRLFSGFGGPISSEEDEGGDYTSCGEEDIDIESESQSERGEFNNLSYFKALRY